jgi:Glu-tRNA(Gln) amidotransferase subunit E-like FAD-binding protein
MKVPEVSIVIKELADLRYKKGYSRKSLIEYLQSEYKLEISRCYALISDMFSQTAEAYAKTNVDALSNSVAFLEELQQSALKENNKKLALEISKELNKLQQLHIQKMEIEMKVEQPLFTPPVKNKDK